MYNLGMALRERGDEKEAAQWWRRAADLNDAPAGIPVDEQMDLTRKLPAVTGVIDLKTFLGALVKIGYDGPVQAEPFDKSLREMPEAEAVVRTAVAMKRAFSLI